MFTTLARSRNVSSVFSRPIRRMIGYNFINSNKFLHMRHMTTIPKIENSSGEKYNTTFESNKLIENNVKSVDHLCKTNIVMNNNSEESDPIIGRIFIFWMGFMSLCAMVILAYIMIKILIEIFR